jgi:hypothetical protein
MQQLVHPLGGRLFPTISAHCSPPGFTSNLEIYHALGELSNASGGFHRAFTLALLSDDIIGIKSHAYSGY